MTGENGLGSNLAVLVFPSVYPDSYKIFFEYTCKFSFNLRPDFGSNMRLMLWYCLLVVRLVPDAVASQERGPTV